VLGADTHKRSHTIAAVAAATGELLGEQTVPVGRRGFGALLRWARRLDGARVWALEDCRHVSGGLERFLIERGERVLRIPTHLTVLGGISGERSNESGYRACLPVESNPPSPSWSSSATRSRTRRAMSSRVARTSATGRPAGSSSSQST
jgi:hypothetical protein